MAKPRIAIEFCTKCRWNFRAVWYLQELLSTFGEDLGEVALIPKSGGIFTVTLSITGRPDVLLWDRKINGGFPDSKELKQLVRNVIAPGRDLGHIDRHSTAKLEKSEEVEIIQTSQTNKPAEKSENEKCEDCIDCSL